MILIELQIHLSIKMAHNVIYTLSLLSCLLWFTSSFQTTTAFSKPMSLDESNKVPVGIYYQAIGNRKFYKYKFSQILSKKLLPIIDLHLCPWGNSIIDGNGTIICRDGEEGCYMNMVEACAIDVWPEVEKHFTFIVCVESAFWDYEKWEKCFDTLRMDRKPIDGCVKSGRGKELVLKCAKETSELKPPHEFTPWVLLEGKAIKKDALFIVDLICKAYKGPSPPEACKGFPHITTSDNKSTKFQFRRNKNLAEAEYEIRS